MKFHITPNDPCYCGSGNKYKYCCKDNPKPNAEFLKEYYVQWQTSRAVNRQLEAQFSELEPATLLSLFDQALGNPFLDDHEVKELVERLGGKEYLFLFSMRIFKMGFYSKVKVSGARRNGARIFKAYENAEKSLGDQESKYAQRIAATPFSFFQILRLDPPGILVELRDVFNDREIKVVDRSISRSAQIGTIIGGRAVPYRDDLYVLETPTQHVISASSEALLVDMTRWWIAEIQSAPSDDFDQCFHEEPPLPEYLVMAVLHPQFFPKIRNTAGHDLVFIDAKFSIGDRDEVEAELESWRNLEKIKGGRGKSEFVWSDKEGTLLGNIVVKASELHFTTNSAERYKKLEKKIKAIGGVKFLKKTEESVGHAMKKRGAGRAEAKEGSRAEIEITPEIRQAVHEQMRKKYATWPDEPLPALDGHTAREMVKSESGRRRVTLLLAEMQGRNSAVPAEHAMYGFSLKFIADELGIELPQQYWD
jgi:hypothetical protein